MGAKSRLGTDSNKYGSQLQDCLNEVQVPELDGIKEPDKENLEGNYHALTCLPLMWTLLTGISRIQYNTIQYNKSLL